MGSPKISFANGEDCLSNLPESIMSRILSRLPTKDAVRTCVLSKDWEFKWTSIYDIKIDDSSSGGHDDEASFANYVDRILFLAHNIRSFHLLLFYEYDSSRLIGWISAVLRRNVGNFQLVSHTREDLLMPRSLLNCNSLTSLKLALPFSPCTFKVPSENCFPNLLDLYFQGVDIRNELSNTDTLTFTFPVLETMQLIHCKWLNVKFVEINAPALTKFVSHTSKHVQVDNYSINIVGGRVTDFQSDGMLPENLSLTGSSVTRVILRFDLLESGLQVRKLLNEFQSLEDLQLSDSVAKAIAQSEQGLALPIYKKLHRLTFNGSTSIGALWKLLHAAPSLKSLVVNFPFLTPSDDDDYEVVESLPYCLLNQLEEVEFSYHGLSLMHDFCLEKFFLKNGLRLKAFRIRCRGDKIEYVPKILKFLLSFPKGSDCLTFVIH